MTPKSMGRCTGIFSETMWIDTPDNLQAIKPPELDESVDVSGDGATQVEKEVGELLVDKFEDITEH